MRPQLVVLGIAVALASCNVPLVTFSVGDAEPPTEDCNAVGDEDGNGLADCADPACAGTPACKSSLTCGNGIVDQGNGEQCDPGPVDSASCNSNMAGLFSCKTSKCGDGYTNMTALEKCD